VTWEEDELAREVLRFGDRLIQLNRLAWRDDPRSDNPVDMGAPQRIGPGPPPEAADYSGRSMPRRAAREARNSMG